MATCKGCDSQLVQDDQNIWRPPSGRASCRFGGPHYPKIEDVPVDWSMFESVMDSWTKD